MLCDLLVCHAFREALLCAGLPCCAVLCCALLCAGAREKYPTEKIYVAGRENVTTQDVRNIQKSYNLDGILNQFYGLGPIWDDLRAILGPRECKRTFQGSFFEDLGSKRDPKWGLEITLEAARSPPEPPKCVLETCVS